MGSDQDDIYKGVTFSTAAIVPSAIPTTIVSAFRSMHIRTRILLLELIGESPVIWISRNYKFYTLFMRLSRWEDCQVLKASSRVLVFFKWGGGGGVLPRLKKKHKNAWQNWKRRSCMHLRKVYVVLYPGGSVQTWGRKGFVCRCTMLVGA